MKNKGIKHNYCIPVQITECTVILCSPSIYLDQLIAHCSLFSTASPFPQTIQMDHHIITATIYTSYCTSVGHRLPTAM